MLFAVAFGTNVPTPLLLRYREVLDLSPTVLTAIFGVYAAGLVPTLFVAGPASDRYGRRAVVLPFTVVAVLASAVFLGASSSLPLLLMGRLLQGAVSGAVFSVGSAWMGELVEDPGTAARRATTALSLGFALGPLTAGLLGQCAPGPLVVPYLVHLGLLAAGLVVLRGVPETLRIRRPDAPLVNLGVPPAARAPFLAFAVPAGLCVFAFPSVSVTVLPLGLQQAMPGLDVAVTGVVAGVTMLSGVLVQQVARRTDPTRAAPLGAAAGTVGVAVGLIGILLDAPWLLLPAAVLLGCGYGLTLASGLGATQLLAAADARGALTSTFYAVAYLGFGVPLVMAAVSDGTDFIGSLVGLLGVGVALAAVLAVGPGRRHLERRRPGATYSAGAAR
ncbi:MFS transporter [Euzebya sp.]|uniref:MFS transporter n=1 Tax=Euzebya sp. TaxID=1971409 RepID=UPI003516D596